MSRKKYLQQVSKKAWYNPNNSNRKFSRSRKIDPNKS